MHIKIKNLAYIKEANIALNGITCIAGINNSGKSTIGKSLFSLVHGVTQYREIYDLDRNEYINDRVRLLTLLLRPSDNLNSDFFRELRHSANRQDYENLLILISEIEELSKDENLEVKLSSKKFKEIIEEIKYLISQDVESDVIKNRTIEKIFDQVFEGQISSLYNNDATELSLCIEKENLITIHWEKNKVVDMKFKSDIPFSNATYIESPYVFQFINFFDQIRRTSFINQRRSQPEYVPWHIADLLQKMTVNHPNVTSLSGELAQEEDTNYQEELRGQITKILSGEMIYDKKFDQFLFQMENVEEPIRMANIASGIKSLSIIQRLLKNGWIEDLSLLIIDEPENHLHPKWQIEFAKFLVELNKKVGTKIVITSHSPYFIEALDVYSKKNAVDKDSSYYLAEIQENGTVMKDVTKHLSTIFDLLSEPLDFLEEERI